MVLSSLQRWPQPIKVEISSNNCRYFDDSFSSLTSSFSSLASVIMSSSVQRQTDRHSATSRYQLYMYIYIGLSIMLQEEFSDVQSYRLWFLFCTGMWLLAYIYNRSCSAFQKLRDFRLMTAVQKHVDRPENCFRCLMDGWLWRQKWRRSF